MGLVEKGKGIKKINKFIGGINGDGRRPDLGW